MISNGDFTKESIAHVQPYHLGLQLPAALLEAVANPGWPWQIMKKRIGLEEMAFLLRGCSANWMPLSVRTVWTLKGKAPSIYCRNSQAVLLCAFATSWAKENLDVWSIPTKRKSLPSGECTSAKSM